MKDKKKWKKIIPFALLALGTSTVAVACSKKPVSEIGPEAGAYYYDADNGEYFIYLNGENNFTFMVKDTTESGSYTLNDDGTLSFNFSSDEYSDVTATWEDGVLTLTYGSDTMRFLKKVNYNVTFDTDGGSAVSTAVVWNGRTLAKPADPVKDGYHFIGWYTDPSHKTLFAFGATPIVENITLYACWEKAIEAQSEYTITLDFGYDEKVETMATISGKLFDVAEPTRAGYTFKGWWLSDYEDGEKLTAAYDEDAAFNANRTLYAVWEASTSSTGAPMVEVSSTKISWNKQSSAAKLRIEGPQGFTTVDETIGATAGTSYAIDFAALPAGDYTISLTVGSATTTRYYRNKALGRVWQFSVVGKSLLVFNSVENAEKYIVTVDCGDDGHVHENFDNGNSTTFNFANCKMQEGGIQFTVTAKAYGYADSVATTFVYNNMLGKVTGYYLDEETDTLLWDGVENAASYVVSVNGGTPVDIGNKTSFSLKNYSGNIAVSVYAKTSGYNSPDATTYSYTKSILATPSSIAIVGDTLRWNAVEGASSYEVQIGSQIFKVNGTSYDLSAEGTGIEWTEGGDYQISVRALAANTANDSLWSDELDARYYALYQSMTYNRNTVFWRAVIGATKYEVKVNDGAAVSVTDGSTSAFVELTQGGYNTISVRFFDGETAGEWVTLEVYAYTITLDSRGGSAVGNLYKAVGDVMTFPEPPTRAGYDFAGWYNIPGGAEANGAEYENEYFAGNGNVTLYAYWAPKVYTVTLNYGDYAADDSVTSAEVTYNKKYKLPVPVITDGRKVFKGWCSSANGVGPYTNEKGESIGSWVNTDNDITLYAFYVDGLEYVESGNAYVVRAGDSISQITNLYIPKEYNGKPVTDITTGAFKGCTSLVTVSIPNTIVSIDESSFEGCTKIKSFTVRDEGSLEPKYSSLEGTLVGKDRDGSISIIAIPLATTGAYTVPSGVEKIPQNAFKSMSGLTQVYIPTSVVKVEKYAFTSCSKLTEITFLEPAEGETVDNLTLNIEFIGTSCTAITTINLPARLNKFTKYDSQPDLTISEAFVKLTKLKDINVTGSNYRYYSSIDGVLCNASGGRTGDTILYCPLGKTGEYVVPTQITKIADRAFAGTISTSTTQPSSGYNGLTKLVFHSGMSSIGEMAFYNNCKVTEIVFEASTAPLGLSIGKQAFYWCTRAKTITFEEEGSLKSRQISAEESETGEAYTQYYFEYTKSCGIRSIGEDAFYGCKETKLLLPSTLETIDNNAFRANTSLVNLDFSHISPTLEFGDMVFNGCTGLTNIEITENVGYVSFASVFYKCTSLATIRVDSNSPYYSTDNYGVLYNKKKTAISYFPEGYTGDYVIPDTVITIGGAVFQGKTNLEKINIPKSVESIGVSAFEGCVYLKEIIFDMSGGNALTIGDNAFYNCVLLTSEITLPSRTKSVGANAFYGTKITAITLNEGLEEIGDTAFKNITTLRSVVIPSTVKRIGKEAFYGCKGLTDLTFTPTAKNAQAVSLYVAESTFYNCSKLETVILPERLQYVSNYMFYGCEKLKSVTIPTTVGNDQVERDFQYGVGVQAFYNCSLLSDITFTKLSEIYTATEIAGITARPLSFGNQAFYNCTSLTELNLPNRIAAAGQVDLKSLNNKVTNYSGYDVFAYTTNSTYSAYAYSDIFIGSQVTSIKDVTSLQRINVEEGGDFASYDGVLYTAGLSKVVFCPQARQGTVEIAYQAETFVPCAFRFCTSVENIVFQATPNGMTERDLSISDAYPIDISNTKAGTLNSYTYSTEVFIGCTNLQEIVFPKRLTSIGAYAFYYGDKIANGITNIVFEEGCRLTKIGEGAFQNTSIESFVMPSSVTTIGTEVFKGCASLTKLVVSESTDAQMLTTLIAGANAIEDVVIPNGNHSIKDVNGIIYNYEITTLVLALSKTQTTEVIIPASVTEISTNAFSATTNLKKITFAAGTENLKIGASAFSGGSVVEIALPSRLIEMGNNVFSGCTSLSSVTFEKGFECTIPNYAFQKCTALEQIEIPAKVLAIGSYAFSDCSKLLSITFEETSQLGSLGISTFQNCTSLTEITLPSKVTSLGAEDSTTGTNYTTDTYNFSGCTNLISVTLPDNIKSIGGYTFRNCSNLKTVTLPSMLEKIGSYVFYGCEKLETVIYGSEDPSWTPAWEAIGNSAFYGCISLTSITIPSSIKNMGTSIFSGCTGLERVTYNSSANIVSSMFYRCASLTEVIFGDSANVKAIGDSAFLGCESLISFTPPSTCTMIGKSAFMGCTDLVSFTYNGTVGSNGYIGESAFEGCSSLKYVTFIEGAQLKEISYAAFRDCTSLETIIIPDSVECLFTSTYSNPNAAAPSLNTSSYVFSGCTSLKEVTMSANVQWFAQSLFSDCEKLTTVNFGDSSKLDTISGYAFRNCRELKSIVFPDSLQTLGIYAFQNCSGLTKVGFNKTTSKLTSILYYAFDGCLSLNEIVLPDALEKLGGDDPSKTVSETSLGYVFNNCKSLKTISFPDKIKTITKACFTGCVALETVDFNNVTVIGESAFYACTSLGSKGAIDINKVEKIGKYAFKNCSALQKVIINSIQSVALGAFNGTQFELVPMDGGALEVKDGMIYSAEDFIFYIGDAQEITLPSGVKTINSGAFMNNKTLKKINLPDTLETINTEAFYNCSNLQTINLNRVTYIDDYAFYGCKALTAGKGETFDISKMTYIGKYAFEGCSSLAVNVDASSATYVDEYAFYNTPIISIKLSSVEKILNYSFAECSELVSVDFGTKLQKMCQHAFENCVSLTTVALPDSLQIFGGNVGASNPTPNLNGYIFAGCTSLTKVTLPSSLTAIGSYNFLGCTKLETVYLGGVTSIGTSCFEGCTALKTIGVDSNTATANIAALDTVIHLGKECFKDCTALEVVKLPLFLGKNGKDTPTGITYSYDKTQIGQFTGCTALKEVHMPLAENIAGSMFKDCEVLTTVNVTADTVKIIYADAFMGTKLQAFDFSAVTTVNDNAFLGTALAGELDLPLATKIGANAFKGCKSLTSIDLPKVTTNLYAYAFADCTGLITVTLNAFTGSASFITSETYMGQFSGCTKLDTIRLPKAKYIASYMFENCAALTDFDITNNSVLLGIGDHAFDGCAALVELDFSGVSLNATSYSAANGIGDYAFANCPNLVSVTVKNLANLGDEIFEGSDKAKLVWVGNETTATEDAIYNTNTKVFIKYLGSATSYQIPSGLTMIAEGAFQGNTTLQSVDLNEVTRLYNYAFADCTALKSIDLSGITSYTYCGTYTFSGCTALTDVTYPSTLTTINNGLFENCTSLASFDFSNVATINASAFKGCTALANVDLSKVYTINANAFEGAGLTGEVNLSTATTLQTRAFADCKGIEKVILTSFVGGTAYSSTYKEQFIGCTSLKEVSMPKATYLAAGMFQNCTALTNFDFSKVIYIYTSAFEGSGLTGAFELPAATSVNKSAFAYCSGITNISIPKATSISESVFEGCTSLTDYDFSNIKYIYASAFEGSGLTGEFDLPLVTTLAARAFANCNGIQKITLDVFEGSSSTYGKSYIEQFTGCTFLKEVSMPRAVSIAIGMFQGCTKLEKVSTPFVATVYANAFDGCAALASVDFTNIESIYAESFRGCTNIKSAVLTTNLTYLESTAFAGWTEEQSISLPSFKWSDFSEEFKTEWTDSCKAIVTWEDEDA